MTKFLATEHKEDTIKNYDAMWKEINSNMAENYFIQHPHEQENDKTTSDENEIWETPRASWRSTSDGYIEAWKIDNSLKSLTGYSKIVKPKSYDRILTETGLDGKFTYNSQITLSYNKVRTEVELSCKHSKEVF